MARMRRRFEWQATAAIVTQALRLSVLVCVVLATATIASARPSFEATEFLSAADWEALYESAGGDGDGSTSTSESMGQYDLVVDIESVDHLGRPTPAQSAPTTDGGAPLHIRDAATVLRLYQERSQMGVVVSVMGLFNRGKTFIVNQLRGSLSIGAGDLVHTRGISAALSRSKNDLMPGIVMLDSAGTNQPATMVDGDHPNDLSFSFVEQLRRKFLDAFLQEAAMKSADVLIIVVNRLTLDDQVYIHKMVSAALGRAFEDEEPSEHSLTTLAQRVIVVHNWRDTETLEDVERLVNHDIKGAFTSVMELPNPELRKWNHVAYRSASGVTGQVTHYVLAKAGSPAGDVYNNRTIEALRAFINNQLQAASEQETLLDRLMRGIQSVLPFYCRFLDGQSLLGAPLKIAFGNATAGDVQERHAEHMLGDAGEGQEVARLYVDGLLDLRDIDVDGMFRRRSTGGTFTPGGQIVRGGLWEFANPEIGQRPATIVTVDLPGIASMTLSTDDDASIAPASEAAGATPSPGAKSDASKCLAPAQNRHDVEPRIQCGRPHYTYVRCNITFGPGDEALGMVFNKLAGLGTPVSTLTIRGCRADTLLSRGGARILANTPLRRRFGPLCGSTTRGCVYAVAKDATDMDNFLVEHAEVTYRSGVLTLAIPHSSHNGRRLSSIDEVDPKTAPPPLHEAELTKYRQLLAARTEELVTIRGQRLQAAAEAKAKADASAVAAETAKRTVAMTRWLKMAMSIMTGICSAALLLKCWSRTSATSTRASESSGSVPSPPCSATRPRVSHGKLGKATAST